MMALGLLEKLSIEVSRGKIPHRVLVCGVRGKTTLARLLHTGFLAAGGRASCRVSGDSPVYIGADDVEDPVRRWGPANIREVRRVLRRMAREETEVAIIENMAIQYELQRVVCRDVVLPTLIVVAPDAPDHLEHWSHDPSVRAANLLETIPVEIPLVFVPAPANRLAYDIAVEQGREVHWPEAPSVHGLPDWSAALVGAVLSVLDVVGAGDCTAAVEDEVIARARSHAEPSLWRVNDALILDLMSANDPETSSTLVEEAVEQTGISQVQLVYHHRSDRPARLASFLPLFQKWPSRLMGDRVPVSLTGVFPAHIGRRASEVMQEFTKGKDKGTLYILLGNTSDEGAVLRNLLAEVGERTTW